ncbi:MAG: L-sorbosone dehydrogenase [Bryobacterales bacterium]|nr:L-sorbosone dehydrogenase [Bryobacterales bacterium]
MHKLSWMSAAAVLAAAGWMVIQAAEKVDAKSLRTGQAAFADAKSLTPGTFHKITPADLPKPFATKSATNFPKVVPRPEKAWPQAPAGFKVELYATNLGIARQIRTAPNGDAFMADQNGQIVIFRGVTKDGKAEQTSVFATGLERIFGVNFYPNGANPQWVYVSNEKSVMRFPYKNGDLKASGAAQTLVSDLPSGGYHFTRDVVFSKDGRSMYVAVGSGSNIDDPDTHPTETHRADILEYTPDGKFVKVYASGIRNPVGLAVNPDTGEVWCSVNERDELGDNLVPDYVSSVKEGGFYGWPFYYMGGNPDPRLNGAHPEMKSKVIVPDVLIQPHSASLGITFYTGPQFPAEYRGDLFAAEHGSWNRSTSSGGEVIRVPLDKGKASGVYEDFLTGFVTPEGQVWGRPVGVAVIKDGSLLVTDEGSKSIWRVSYTGK